MVTESQITEIGRLNQPHGIKGEINAVAYDGIELSELSCIILDVDGIFVPFFMSGIRRRGTQSYLITIEGIENEQKASSIANKTIFALSDEVKQYTDNDEEGFYAEDFIGFRIISSDGELNGIVTDIDDSTENVLFIVKADSGKKHLIPVADEIITGIDIENRQLTVELPAGLLEI